MILDQFGRQVRASGVTFNTPDWLKREYAGMVGHAREEMRVQQLRASVGSPLVLAQQAGETITVRVPKRWETRDPATSREQRLEVGRRSGRRLTLRRRSS